MLRCTTQNSKLQSVDIERPNHEYCPSVGFATGDELLAALDVWCRIPMLGVSPPDSIESIHDEGRPRADA